MTELALATESAAVSIGREDVWQQIKH